MNYISKNLMTVETVEHNAKITRLIYLPGISLLF
jgi:hypothetical protein